MTLQPDIPACLAQAWPIKLRLAQSLDAPTLSWAPFGYFEERKALGVSSGGERAEWSAPKLLKCRHSAAAARPTWISR